MALKTVVDNIGLLNIFLAFAAVVSSNTVATIMGFYLHFGNVNSISPFIDAVFIQDLVFGFLFYLTVGLIFSRLAFVLIQQYTFVNHPLPYIVAILTVLIFTAYLYTGSFISSILVITLSTSFTYASSLAWYRRQNNNRKITNSKNLQIQHLNSLIHGASIIRRGLPSKRLVFSIRQIFSVVSVFIFFGAITTGFSRSLHLSNTAYKLVLYDKSHIAAYIGDTSNAAVLYSNITGELSINLVSHNSEYILVPLFTTLNAALKNELEVNRKIFEENKKTFEENKRELEETAKSSERL